MWPIERHAYKIYTEASFMLFRKQVDRAASYIVSGKGENFYVVSHNSPGERPGWAKVDFKVYVLDDGSRYYCECGFYEHLGILCCHTIRVSFQHFIILYMSINILLPSQTSFDKFSL